MFSHFDACEFGRCSWMLVRLMMVVYLIGDALPTSRLSGFGRLYLDARDDFSCAEPRRENVQRTSTGRVVQQMRIRTFSPVLSHTGFRPMVV